jgi:UDP-glucose 4-epimerase
VVGALIRLIESRNAVGEVYNIGSDREVTILELAEKVKSLTGSDSSIVFTPYDQAYEEGFEDMLRRVPDLSKIHKLIEYRPTVDLDEILESVIDYQRSELTASRAAAGAMSF